MNWDIKRYEVRAITINLQNDVEQEPLLRLVEVGWQVHASVELGNNKVYFLLRRECQLKRVPKLVYGNDSVVSRNLPTSVDK